MTEEARSKPDRWIPDVFFVFAVICFAGYPCSMWIDQTKSRSDRAAVVSSMKDLVIALRAYASDWEDGGYPDTLDELFPDYIDDESLLTAVGPDGDRRPWIYHGGKTDSSFSRDVLIEYPFPINGRRIAGFAGGHVSEMPAANAENP